MVRGDINSAVYQLNGIALLEDMMLVEYTWHSDIVRIRELLRLPPTHLPFLPSTGRQWAIRSEKRCTYKTIPFYYVCLALPEVALFTLIGGNYLYPLHKAVSLRASSSASRKSAPLRGIMVC